MARKSVTKPKYKSKRKVHLSDDPIIRAGQVYERLYDEQSIIMRELDSMEARDHRGRWISGKLRKGVNPDKYKARLEDYGKAIARTLKAYDAVQAAMKAEREKPIPPAVPVEELQSLISESMQEGLSGMQINLKVGLLSYQVANALTEYGVAEHTFDPPRCEDCSGG